MHTTRRSFLNRCASAGAAGGAALARARAVHGAGDRVRVALIGSGGMGRGNLLTFLREGDVDCPLVCDVDDAMLVQAQAAVEKLRGVKPASVKDFRRVMERGDIDACIVATPDHWHALPTIHACQAGKDVYVEKPLATSIGEGRAMVAAARKHKRVVQVGMQWRSGGHYQDAVKFVQSGALGTVRIVRAWACLAWVGSIGRPVDGDPPAGVDYDLWLGPAPRRPFNPARFHFNFRWFWDYAGGLQADWGVHLLNVVHWAMRVDAPLRVSSSGGKYVMDDLSETPDTQCTVFEYPGFMLVWDHQVAGTHGVRRREHGVSFEGTNGTLVVDGGGWEVIPDPNKGLEPLKASPSAQDARWLHVKDFLGCVRSGARPVTDVETGHHVTAACHLGNIAMLTGSTVTWDAEREQAVDNPGANALLSRPYRSPWTLPA